MQKSVTYDITSLTMVFTEEDRVVINVNVCVRIKATALQAWRLVK